MKSFRWTLLLAIAVAALIAFTVFDYERGKKDETAKAESSLVVRYPVESITGVEISHAGQVSVAFEKKNDVWQVTAPIADHADVDAVESFLAGLRDEKRISSVAKGADVQLDVYGLEHPTATVKLTSKEDKSEEVSIGSVKAYDNSLYARISGDGGTDDVWLVTSSWDSHLAKLGKEFRDKHILRTQVLANQLERVEIRRAGASGTSLKKDASGWHVLAGGPNFAVPDERVTQFIDAVKGVRAKDFVAEGAKEIAAYDVSSLKKPWLEIELVPSPGSAGPAAKPIVLDFAKPTSDTPKALARGAKAPPSASLARSSEIDALLSVHGKLVETVDKSAQDFYDRRVPFQFAKGFDPGKDVVKFRIDSPVVKAEFAKTGETWQSTVGGLQKPVDGTKLVEAMRKLGQWEAVRILSVGQKPASLQKVGELQLIGANGQSVYSLAWGAPMTEKADEHRPEAVFLPMRTDRTEAVVGVSEGELRMLLSLLTELITPPKTAPTPRAATAEPTPTAH